MYICIYTIELFKIVVNILKGEFCDECDAFTTSVEDEEQAVNT